MSDINEADLTALLAELRDEAANGYKTCQYAALRALIAERYRLGKCVVDLERQLEAQPPADRDRELRERLVCAIWPELLRIFERTDTEHNDGANWDLVRINARARALDEADAMIAEMRKRGGA